MPKEKLVVKTKTAPKKAGPDYWKDVLDGLGAAGGGSDFIFPKNGKTLVRLIQRPNSPFYAEVESTFRNRTKTKYMLMAWKPAAKDEEAEDKVRGLILPKTAFKAIVALLAEGYEFFDPTKGHGLSIVRSGEALDTNYTIVPSNKEVPLPVSLKKQIAETSFDKLIKTYDEMRNRRGGKSTGSGEGSADGDEEADSW